MDVQYCTMTLPEKKEILCKERFFHGKAVPCGRLGRTVQKRALGV